MSRSLASPPPPPVLHLEAPLGPDELADALRAFSSSYYATHPFHQLMHEGRLSREDEAVLPFGIHLITD